MTITEQGIWKVTGDENRVYRIIKAGTQVAVINPEFINLAEISFSITREFLEIRLGGQPIMRLS